MNVFYLTDPHFNPYSEFSRPDNNWESENTTLLYNVFREFSDVVYERSSSSDMVVIGGDCLDSNGFLDPVAKYWLEKSFSYLFECCRENNTPVYILVGNHDVYDRARSITLISYLEGWYERCKVVNQPYLLPEQDIAMVPYLYKEEYQQLEDILNRFSLVFSHQDYLSAHIGPKKKSEEGFSLGKISDKTVVVNGHYHNPAEESIGEVRLIHPGSPCCRNFSDSPVSKRGFHVFNFNEDGYDRKVIAFKEGYYYYKSEIDDLGQIKAFLSKISEPSKARVRIMTSLSPADLDSVKKEFEGVFKYLDFKEQHKPLEVPDVTGNREEGEQEIDFYTAADSYVNSLDTSLDKQKLKNTITEVYES